MRALQVFFSKTPRVHEKLIQFGARYLAQATFYRARSPTGLAEKVRFGVRHGPSTRWYAQHRRAKIGPQASSVQVWHFPGQKLRLGGDAMGADPTYLLYLPSRSHGGI